MKQNKQEVALIEKAYGGCHDCYGKGYATVRYGYSIAPDFIGDKEVITSPETNIQFCSCSRGKQLKQLLQRERERAYKDGYEQGQIDKERGTSV